MTYTNLNITDGNHQFRYILEYIDDKFYSEKPLKYIQNDNGIFFVGKENDDPEKEGYINTVKELNYWSPAISGFVTGFTPVTYNISSFNLYFPRFSVETYERNVKYVLSINTWIRGKYVYLGSFVIDRSNCLAIGTGPKTFFNDKYYEYVRLETIDPYYFIYGDEWAEFRAQVCGSQATATNDGGSNLNITFCPVEFVDGKWIKLTGYEESQSAMLITTNVDDYLSCSISSNVDNPVVVPRISAKVNFNQTYEQSNEGLTKYMYETYSLTPDQVDTRFVCVVKDKENAYRYIEHKEEGFNQSDTFVKDEFKFDSWSDYKEGMSISVIYMITPRGTEDEEWIVISSNTIFLDQELFKFFVGKNPFNSVKLNNIDMNNININAVNKVFSQVIQMERPDDYKANIQKPVFVKVQPVGNITIHPAVTENIVINLDAYKNKVRVFSIKIKDQLFLEIGRIANGVIFKIVGSKLEFDKGTATGTYYILNDEGVLVTTGNYTAVL